MALEQGKERVPVESTRRVHSWPEYDLLRISRRDLPMESARQLKARFGSKITIESSPFDAEPEWIVQSRGWVGTILFDDFEFRIQPKVPVTNIFRMLEYAYRLKQFKILEGLVATDTLDEFFGRLAAILAKRVMDRSRIGLYKSYDPRNERLPFVRGRMQVRETATRPWDVQPRCHYDDHTADIVDNRILCWTLDRVARTGPLLRDSREIVRRAFRGLRGSVSVTPQEATDCVGRLYNRLNSDYEPLHALCHFFLEHTGPQLRDGTRATVPFLIDMARLFEMFVAEWLRERLPDRYQLNAQTRMSIDPDHGLHFDADILILDAATRRVLMVIDTKYKDRESPAADDVHQVISYAHTWGASNAILVYPRSLPRPLDSEVRGIRVRTVGFDLEDLEAGGDSFLGALLAPMVGS